MLHRACKALAFVLVSAGVCGTGLAPSRGLAQEAMLVDGLADLRFTLNGQDYVIARNQDPDAVIEGDFARVSRACPPFCIQPMAPVAGVATLGELELLVFLRDKVAGGTGVLLDARLPEWFGKGSIPAAVNVPFATLAPENPFRNDILEALGAKPLRDGAFDFAEAPDLVVFCNGAWSDQALRALEALKAAGYPPEKLSYYRGGMQDWVMLGLTVSGPEEAR